MTHDKTDDDLRLIEDYIPIEAISAEARREKSIRKGHISTLHLWWARRPLVAARAAVYGALVPAPENRDAQKAADKFVAGLCKYPGSRHTIAEAQRHILTAHAERLTQERAELVTVEDIRAGRAPRPRVLDMFAGGGAIPLEALRLGCEAYAVDLNPVAHLIELCTLVYPQQYGQPDPAEVGCAAIPSPTGGGLGRGSWAGLAEEVAYWGKWVLEQVKAEIGDLYPPIPDPRARHSECSEESQAQLSLNLPIKESRETYDTQAGMLTPVAYLWTRTVRCKNPACGATIPLARQTWLCKKKGRYVALKPMANLGIGNLEMASSPPETSPSPFSISHSPISNSKTVRYEVVEAKTEKGLGFDPAGGSRGGNVACPFCGTVADSAYVKAEGKAGRMGVQPMAVVCTHPTERGKRYLAVEDVPESVWPDDEAIWARIRALEAETVAHPGGPLTAPEEPVRQERPSPNARGLSAVTRYGFTRFCDLFNPRQLLSLLSFSKQVRSAYATMVETGYTVEQAKAITAYLGILVNRVADYNSAFCSWHNTREVIGHTFARQALPMIWDFVEVNPLGDASGNAFSALDWIVGFIQSNHTLGMPANTQRTSATSLPYQAETFDAIVTDPPYYDNVPYSDLSDFFYVWLKRSIGFIFPEHFSSFLGPKKKEAIMDTGRYGDENAARSLYEELMAQAFAEAGRTLKPGAPLVIVYAHKTTLGWATLVDALRVARFTVTEAWPLDTEMGARLLAMDSAALASSIFLVARRREGDITGSYEREVRPDLEQIVRERVERLWAQGVTGADLVIACVGAGLRAFTRYARVEYANGEQVPADTFLAEVEGVVLETLLEKLFGVDRTGISSVDRVTRFYVLWRFAYRHAAIDAGEAIVFAYPQRVELDGPGGLSSGSHPLVEKQRSKYYLRDFAERGDDEDLGKPHTGETAPLIDVLHRVLWLVENAPHQIPAYLDEARPDIERLRIVAQTLAGQTLAGNGSGGGKSLVAATGAEAAALRKLTTNWRTLIEERRSGLL